MPKVIVIDGSDATGKETQSKLLVDHLRSQGKSVLHIEVPWRDGVTHPVIYWMLRSGWAKTLPSAFQLVQLANKLLCQSLEVGRGTQHDYIVMDRWQAAAEVYGVATGAAQFIVNLGNVLLFVPDATVLFVGEPFPKPGKDVYESDTDLQELVRNLYKFYPVEHPDEPIALVDSHNPREEVHQAVLQVLRNMGVL